MKWFAVNQRAYNFILFSYFFIYDYAAHSLHIDSVLWATVTRFAYQSANTRDKRNNNCLALVTMFKGYGPAWSLMCQSALYTQYNANPPQPGTPPAFNLI